MHQVFISYKSDDSALAMKVVKALEENGIPCWIAERDIRTGSNYARDIPSAIKNANFLLLLLTSKSQESPWVLRELDVAITQRKTILPFKIGAFRLNDEMNFLLIGVQHHTSTLDMNRSLLPIIRQIKDHMGATPSFTQEQIVPLIGVLSKIKYQKILAGRR